MQKVRVEFEIDLHDAEKTGQLIGMINVLSRILELSNEEVVLYFLMELVDDWLENDEKQNLCDLKRFADWLANCDSFEKDTRETFASLARTFERRLERACHE